MIILNKPVLTYRCHVTKQYFKIGFYNTESNGYVEYEISSSRNDFLSITNMLSLKQIFIGYNCIHLEKPLCNFLVKTKKDFSTLSGSALYSVIYQTYNRIKNDDPDTWKDLKYDINFASVDLMSLLFSKIQSKPSLRQFQLENGLNVDDTIYSECSNLARIANKNHVRIESRFKMSIKYRTDVTDDDDVVAGIKIFKAMYAKSIGIKQSELPAKKTESIRFGDNIILSDSKRKIAKFFKLDLSNINLDKPFSYFLNLHNTNFSITKAGLKSNIDIDTYNGIIYYIDIKSMFPTMLLIDKLKPRHMSDTFIDQYKILYDCKMHINESNDSYKIIKNMINGIIGYMNVENSYLYDPWINMSIKMDAAFTMCQLISLLPEDVKIIMVNIDSICMQCNSMEDLYESKRIIDTFCNNRNIKYNEQLYKKWCQLSINDYVAITKDNNVVAKGIFSNRPSTPACVTNAIIDNLMFGKDVCLSIKSNDNPNDYMLYNNAEQGVNMYYNNKMISNSQRYYYSTTGYFLTIKSENAKSFTNITKKSGVVLCDQIPYKLPKDINYSAYISEANAIIAPFKTKQLKLF